MQKIKQAPTTSKKLGHALRRFEQTSSSYEMMYDVSRKKWRHGLTEDEVKVVEKYYSRKFENPDDREFWSGLSFEVRHDIDPIESIQHPPDLLKVRVLQVLGVVGDAISILEGESTADFMLSDNVKETAMKASVYEKRDEAISKLIAIKKSKKYCMAVAKYLLPTTVRIDTLDDAYTKIREYLDGNVIKGKNEAIRKFNEACEMDKTLLYVTVDFNSALHKNIIRKNASNKFYNPMSGTEFGKNGQEAISFLMQPSNQDELGTGGVGDKDYSIRVQLKNR